VIDFKRKKVSFLQQSRQLAQCSRKKIPEEIDSEHPFFQRVGALKAFCQPRRQLPIE
jgi:hypothetical protein